MSGWVTRLDFNGDGKQDFWGRPGGFVMSARYVNDSTGGSFMPHFAGKENGCVGYCAFADFTGGGHLEVVNERRVVSNMAGAELWPSSGDNAYLVVGDVPGNGWPDIVRPANGASWRSGGGYLAGGGQSAFSGRAGMEIPK